MLNSPEAQALLSGPDIPMLIVLPNYVSDRIDAMLDAEIEKHPDAASDRDLFRQQLVNYFAQTGEIPEFTLARNPPAGA